MDRRASGVHKPWDRKMKRLFRKAPEDIIQWLFPGAEYQRVVSSELEGETIFADHLYELTLNGKQFLLHIEFQRNHDPDMAERMWAYNVRATIQYSCPVWSVLIYLKQVKTIEQDFWVKELPNGRPVHRFDFSIIRLWEVPTDELWEKGLPGLYPLLALTKDGARREVIEGIISELTQPGNEHIPKADLLMLTYGLASLVFDNEEDQNWLIGRFAMLDDILMETRAFQEISRKAEEKGQEEGRKEGREEALQVFRSTLVSLVQERFATPNLTSLVNRQADDIHNMAILQDLILKIGLAQSSREVFEVLLNGSDMDNAVN
jgi:predicted transposase YdaD